MDIQANGMGSDQGTLIAELARLKAENEALRTKAAARGTISFKVGTAGGVSAYGLGRYPVTLYRSQWERLIRAIPALQDFIEAHASELKAKE